MFLRIESLELTNIRCFASQQFNFVEGVNVITGPNGAGKSTIITSIGFGLFGYDYLKGMNLTISDLIMRGEELGEIELTFSTQDGTFTSFHRIRESGDYWKLYQQGTNGAIAETISDSREVVQSLLGEGVDAQIFKTALCSRQGELTKLLDDAPAERSDQIRKILGLDNFDKAETVLDKYQKNIVNKIQQLEGELDVLQETKLDKPELQQEMAKKTNLLDKTKQKLIRDKQRVAELQEGIDTLLKRKEQINVNQDNLDIAKENKESISTQLKQLKETIQDFREGFGLPNLTTKVANNLLQNKNQHLNKIELNLQKKGQQIQRYQELKEEFDSLTVELKAGKQKLNSLKHRLEAYLEQQTLEDRETQFSDLKTLLDTYDRQVSDLKERLYVNQAEQDKISSRITTIKKQNRKLVDEFLSSFDADIAEVDHLLLKKKKKHNELIIGKDQIQGFILEKQEELGRINGKIANLEQTIEVLKATDETHDCPVCGRGLDQVDTDKLQQIHHRDLLTLQQDRDTLQEKLVDLQSNFETISETIHSLTNQISQLERYSEKHKVLEDRTTQLGEHKDQLTELHQTQIDLEKQIGELQEIEPQKKQEELGSIKEGIATIRNLQKEHDLLSQKQSSLDQRKQQLEQSLKDYNSEKLRTEITEHNNQREIIREEIDDLVNKVLPQLERQTKLQSEYSRLQTVISELSAAIAELKDKFDPQHLKKQQRKQQELNQMIGGHRSNISNYQERIEQLEQELQTATEQEELMEYYTKELMELDGLLPVAQKIRNILGDAPELLISKTSSKISSHLTNMVKRLLPDQGFDKVIFRNDGDLHLFNNNRRIEKTTLSGGEKTVLALSLRMALADYVAPLQFLTLDEPTNHLDRQRVEEFMEIIDREQLFTSSRGQLLLVTHREEFNRNAQESIQLEIKRETIAQADEN